MRKRRQKRDKLTTWFLVTGAVCFSSISVYMGILMWKSYVWAKWLHRLQDSLNRYESGAGPII